MSSSDDSYGHWSQAEFGHAGDDSAPLQRRAARRMRDAQDESRGEFPGASADPTVDPLSGAGRDSWSESADGGGPSFASYQPFTQPLVPPQAGTGEAAAQVTPPEPHPVHQPRGGGGAHAASPAGRGASAVQEPRHDHAGVQQLAPASSFTDSLGERGTGAPMPGASEPGRQGAQARHSVDLHDAMASLVQQGASDLHLTVGVPPMMRVNGMLSPLPGFPVLTKDSLTEAIHSLISSKQRARFEETLELDASYSLPHVGRFRMSVFRQRESLAAVLRVIPIDVVPLESLGLPRAVASFATLQRGLVLVTGTTGSGKSTTLTGILDLANKTRHDHILTVEDPIEFLHRHHKCIVNQREVGEDTRSFSAALKHALRQDPDIILVGEMRDLETISVALTAAETGHLVLGTLHTQDAVQTVDRVIDVFPSAQQQQVRVMLAGVLQGVVCQSLVEKFDGSGRLAAAEVMLATPGIRNLIREGKTHQVYTALQSGGRQGMVTMDQSLASLVRSGQITMETGFKHCHHVEEFRRLSASA